MAFDFTGVSAFINETDNLNDIFRRSMFGNDSAPYLNQLQGVKATNALPSINHEQGVLISAASELTTSSFNGDVDVRQVDLVTAKVAYFNKFRIDELEGYFTQKYLPAGASYGLGEVEGVLAAMLADSIPQVISKQVEQLTWQGDTAGAAPFTLVNGFNKITAALPTTSAGAFTASNTLGYLEGLVDAAMGDADWAAALNSVGGAYIYTGWDVIRDFAKNYRSSFTASAYNTEFNKWMIDGTNVMLIGCSGLTGANTAYLAKSDVFVQGSDLSSDQNNIVLGMDQLQEYVWAKCKFRLGFASRDTNAKSILVHRAVAVS